MKIKFTGANILTADDNFTEISDGIIIVDGSQIAYVGKKDIEYKCDKIIDVKGDILMPGLINCHTHLAMSLFRGISEDHNLDSWLSDVIFPMESKLNAEDVFYGTMLSLLECARGGTTYVADSYYFNESSAEAAKLSGIGMAILGADMDINKSYQDVVKKIENDYKNYNKKDNNLKYIPGCHSIYTCSQKLLEAVADFCAAKKTFPYIHLSETLKEVGDCTLKNNGLTPPQYLHKIGYFDNGGLAAHVVHADKDDISLLKQCNVSAVHCPASNLKLGSGVAPVYSMLNYRLNVALGTDSSASNNSLDMFKEMYLSSALQKGVMNLSNAVPPKISILMATRNAAKALNLTDRGCLQKGFKADIIRLNTKQPHYQPITDRKNAIVYSAKSHDVVMTMASGKIIYDGTGYNIGLDEDEIYKKCNLITKRLMKNVSIM